MRMKTINSNIADTLMVDFEDTVTLIAYILNTPNQLKVDGLSGFKS